MHNHISSHVQEKANKKAKGAQVAAIKRAEAARDYLEGIVRALPLRKLIKSLELDLLEFGDLNLGYKSGTQNLDSIKKLLFAAKIALKHELRFRAMRLWRKIHKTPTWPDGPKVKVSAGRCERVLLLRAPDGEIRHAPDILEEGNTWRLTDTSWDRRGFTGYVVGEPKLVSQGDVYFLSVYSVNKTMDGAIIKDFDSKKPSWENSDE